VNVAKRKTALAFFETESRAGHCVMDVAAQEIHTARAHSALGSPQLEQDGHAQGVVLRLSRNLWVSK